MNIGSSLTLIKEEINYQCKIIDKNEEYIYIDYPFDENTGKTAFLLKETALQASFIDEQKNVFQFETKVVRYVGGTVPSIAILRPAKENIKRIQRRDFVRVPAALDVSVLNAFNNKAYFNTNSSDISGGGISIVVPKGHKLKEEDEYLLKVMLSMKHKDAHYISVKGKVVRFSEKNKVRLASFKFTNITKDVEQQIVRFCFEKQREKRRKELK